MQNLGEINSKLVLSINDVIALTGFGRTKLYEELNSGCLPAKKFGKRTVIILSDLEEYLSQLETYPIKPKEV